MKKYDVIIYDFSWKVWAPLLKMSYQKLYYSLTWINVRLSPWKEEPQSPFPPPHPSSIYIPIITLRMFSFLSNLLYFKKTDNAQLCTGNT